MNTTTRKRRYKDKLQDPRWQQRRLEMMQKSRWRCSLCDDTESMLHVHHLEYSGDPWEAEDHQMIVLCESCHAAAHSTNDELKRMFMCAVRQFDFCRLIDNGYKDHECFIQQLCASELAALMRSESINEMHAPLRGLQAAEAESSARDMKNLPTGGTVISYGIIKRTFKDGMLTWSLIKKRKKK